MLTPILIFLISAATHAEDVSLAPIQVEDQNARTSDVVTSEDIDKNQARDLRDTFKETPEVVVGGSQRAAQKVYVRSLEDTNLNVTVDGSRQSAYLFRYQSRLNVDPELLKEVRVEAGTGDALAGPGALGGALKFVTKDAEDLLSEGEKWGALGKVWYHTNDSEKGTSLALFGKPSESLSALGHVTLTEAQDYRSGGGDAMPYTGGRPKAGLLKFAYRPGAEHKISVGTNYTTDNASRIVRTNYGFSPNTPVGERKFETTNTTVNYDFVPTGSAHALNVNAYFADNKLINEAIDSTARGKSRGLSAKDAIEHKRWKLTYGGEAHADEANAMTSTTSGQERGTIYALFTQGRYDLTERLRASAGVRYDDYRLKANDDRWYTGSHVSPNGSLAYQWTKAWNSRLGWSQAYRGPVPVEVLLLAFATSVAPVDDLRGTTAETIELVNEVKLEEARAALSLTLFSTVLQNPLEVNLKNNAITRANADSDVTVRGLEFKAKKTFGDVGGSVFYTRSTTKYGDGSVGYAGNFARGASLGDRLGASAAWHLPGNVALSWIGSHVWELSNVPAGSPRQPGYDVHDLTATWIPTERLRTWVMIANVLDKKYVAQGSLYAGASGVENQLYEPGRDFKLAVSYQF